MTTHKEESREFKPPCPSIQVFLNPQLFFPDTASVLTHPANSAANPDIFATCGQANSI